MGSEFDWVHAMKGAVVCGDAERVRELLAHGCSAELDVNPGPYPYQLLAFAARNLQVEICRVLLEAGADPKGWPQHNHIPLRDAAGATGQNGVDSRTVGDRLALCEMLLERGANPNEVGKGGCETSLHKVGVGLSGKQPIELLRLLVRYGGDPSYIPPRPHLQYQTPLQKAVRFGDLEVAKFYFEECGQDPFQKTLAGRSLLQHCSGHAASECKEMIREFQLIWRSNSSQMAVADAIGASDVDERAEPPKQRGFSPV